MQTNQQNNQSPLHNYEPVSEEDYADLKFDTEETRPYTYDLDQRDKGVSKFDIVMDNLVSGVNALIKLNEYAVSPVSRFKTKELDWNPKYNSAMEEIVEVAKKDPVNFTKAVAGNFFEGAKSLVTEPEVVIPEYIKNISGAAKDHFTKSIDDYLRQMYGPEVTVFNATEEQMTEARSAMLFRTLEASELLGITAAAPKVARTVAMGGMNSYRQGVDFINYSAPKVKENILNIAETLSSNAEEAMGLVPVKINAGYRNNTSNSFSDKISAMIATATEGDIKNKTGSMYRPSGWGSRQTYPQAKQRIENYFNDLEDKFEYDFEENFTEDFKKLSVFHQEDAIQFLSKVWQEDGWTIGPNNTYFTEISDHLAKFDANKFIKSSFSEIKNASIWEFIRVKANRPFDPSPQPYAIPEKTGDYSFNYSDADGNIQSFGTSIDPPTFKLSELLDHKELFKAYPELENLKIRFFDNPRMKNDPNTMAYFSFNNPQDDYIAMNYNHFEGRPPEQWIPTLLHEIQHAIEHRSGIEIVGKSVIKDHLQKKLGLIDQTLKDMQPYLNGKGTGTQSMAFMQGTNQGNYNIIFLEPNNVANKNAGAKDNLGFYLSNEFNLTTDYDPSEWRAIDLDTAENLLKIQLYDAKTQLGSSKMIDIGMHLPTGKDIIPIFDTTFKSKLPEELAGGLPQIIKPEIFFERINSLAFKRDPSSSPTIGDIFETGKKDQITGTSPIPQLGLNIEPDFFNSYLATINEVMADITGTSFEMNLPSRQKKLPYERISIKNNQIENVNQKGIFGTTSKGETYTGKDISLAELIYYMSDKQSATKSLEDIHANLAESIKTSNVMKNSFYPEMQKAILKYGMDSNQADKYYNDWINGFADALLFTRHNAHVTMGTNVEYAKLKKINGKNLSKFEKTFTRGLGEFGMKETANIISNIQQTFITKYLDNIEKTTGKKLGGVEDVDEDLLDNELFDLFTQLDNVWQDTRIKPEEIVNVTPLYDDIGVNLTGMSKSNNYVQMQGLMIDGKKIGGF